MKQIKIVAVIFCLFYGVNCGGKNVQDLIDSGEINSCFVTTCTLNIAHKKLTSLVGIENVAGAETIKILDASGNQLETLTDCSFDRFVHLSQLYLNNNKLEKFTSLCASSIASNVRELHLAHNYITTLDMSHITALPSLYVLNLGFNHITKIVPALGDLVSRLEVLYLNDNAITELPSSGFSVCPHLQALYVQNNRIGHLVPNCFSGLVSARLLYLQNNALRYIAAHAFSDMQRLHLLYLGSNSIEQFENGWSDKLTNLSILDISHNHLSAKKYCTQAVDGLAHLQHCYTDGQKQRKKNQADIDAFLSKVRPEVYQDIVVNGEVIKQGVKDCDVRYANIKKVLDTYNRSITILDIGASEGNFSLWCARRYDCTCVMIEGDKTLLLPEICKLNADLGNLIVLEKFITPQDLRELAACEHFDVVLAFNVVHQMKGAWQETIDALLTLGDNVLIETPPPGCHTSANKEILPLIEDYLQKDPRGSIVGNVPRYGNPGLPGPDQKYSHVYLFQMHKKVLSKPAWGSPHNRYYPVLSTSAEKSLYKPRIDKVIEWKSGINLWTFKHLNGVYPSKNAIHDEIKRLSAFVHNDFLPWNMIIQGNHLDLIDWDDNTNAGNAHNYQACIQQFGV